MRLRTTSERDRGGNRAAQAAFTLIEVMIAMTIFFAATFAILGLMSQNLRSAQLLRKASPHAGILASELSLTNRLEEGFLSGDFGDMYPSFSWDREILLVGSNGLYEVNFKIYRGGDVDSEMTILLYRPDSLLNLPGTGGGRR